MIPNGQKRQTHIFCHQSLGVKLFATIEKIFLLRFLKGVVIAESFALWLEFFYKLGLSFNPTGFLISIHLYFLFLCGLHGAFSILKERRFFWLIGIAIGGIAGLLMEWFLVGNSPWEKPAVFQSGQFLFHGVYPILGYLLVNTPVTVPLRNRLLVYMVAASGVTSIGFFFGDPNLQNLWFLFLPLVVFVGLYDFIYRLGTLHPHTAR